MYEAVLGLLLVVAGLNRSARPFALVMGLNWAVNYILATQYGLYAWVSVVDSAAFIAMALMTSRAPRWWSFIVAEMAFAAVIVHAAYWTSLFFGLYLGHQYQIILNGAFLVSAFILVIGGFDVAGNFATLIDRSRCTPRMRGSRLHTRTKTVESSREDAR